jgi:hypothetical protein
MVKKLHEEVVVDETRITLRPITRAGTVCGYLGLGLTGEQRHAGQR